MNLLKNKLIKERFEATNGDYFKRCEEIIDIMITEYGYEINKKEKDSLSYIHWILFKSKKNKINNHMRKLYSFDNMPSYDEIAKRMANRGLKLLQEKLNKENEIS